MADDEGIVTFPFCLNGIGDHLTGATEFNQGMCIGIERRDANDLYLCSFIDDISQMGAQVVPIGRTVFVVDIALIANADWRHGFLNIPVCCVG